MTTVAEEQERFGKFLEKLADLFKRHPDGGFVVLALEDMGPGEFTIEMLTFRITDPAFLAFAGGYLLESGEAKVEPSQLKTDLGRVVKLYKRLMLATTSMGRRQ